jgi:hypothetical protein
MAQRRMPWQDPGAFDPTVAPTEGLPPVIQDPNADTYTPPNGNTGTSGYGEGGKPVPPVEGTPAPQQNTRLEGFEAGKLGTGHGGKSPKYAFGDLANSGQYGYQDGAKLLADLQSQYDYFDNWELQGGDKFRWNGQGQLNNAFEGVNEIDFVRNFTQGSGFDPNQSAFVWGARGGPGDADGQAAADAGGPAAGNAGGFDGDALRTALAGLFPNGAFNEDVVSRRSEGAAENLRRFNKGRMGNNRAALAERGLIGSGPEATEAFNRESDIADRYAQEVSGIYADESENADARMMQALSLAAGLDTADADRLLGYHRADNDFTLGRGNIALGNFRAQNDYNLGLGDFGLRRDQLLNDMENGDTDQMIKLLELLMGGANTSANGHF